jgi:hypothetical protein
MNQPGKTNPTPPIKSVVSTLPVVALGGQIGCFTLVIVIAAVLGGLWLDELLGTKPILTVIFILGSAPLTLVLTYWMAMQTIKKINPPTPDVAQTELTKEEKSGE